MKEVRNVTSEVTYNKNGRTLQEITEQIFILQMKNAAAQAKEVKSDERL